MDHLENNEYIGKIESEVNDYVNPYAICDDIDFNWLMKFVMPLELIHVF